MQPTYYIVMLNGVPVDVTKRWAKAVQSQKELSVTGKSAIILPVVPIQTELDLGDFNSEETTEPDFSDYCKCDV